MEDCSDWSRTATPTSINGINKLTCRELLFPENLSTESLKIHLINRSIIKENSSQSKEELIALFRQHVVPRSRRRSDTSNDTLNLSNSIKAVSLNSLDNSRTPERYICFIFGFFVCLFLFCFFCSF